MMNTAEKMSHFKISFSAWNWCNKLDKKHYYPIFKLCGFTGFDGSFKN